MRGNHTELPISRFEEVLVNGRHNKLGNILCIVEYSYYSREKCRRKSIALVKLESALDAEKKILM